MTVIDDSGEPLTAPELQAQFQRVRDQCDREPEGPGIGALTGDNRTSWAQVINDEITIGPLEPG
ncbi:hypothetical protein DPMN_058790 [Dreissena polymorpha]|uniref:Choline/carnitine acyltransferase domain-containing protein n=1 Tax=Dreissena polymorpha TaxID=45954 RepID=A0A9D4HFV6_DREPO|nr:hypothetical protein DPMN_058790 [Dreissena polymorpha]